jgi:hypothetical protein
MPIFIWIFSNGQVWFSKEPKVPGGASTYTLVSCFRVNSLAKAQAITTLTGSGNSSSSALAATGGTGATLSATSNPTIITELT